MIKLYQSIKSIGLLLGPDATGVGWVYMYALDDRSRKRNLSELRSLQDWFLKFELQTVEGVSEIATVGGMVSALILSLLVLPAVYYLWRRRQI